MPHHRCAHHLAERADVRQAGRAVAGLEQNLAVMVRGFQPFDQVAGLGKGPGVGVAGGVTLMVAILSVMMIGSCVASRPGAIILDRPGVAPSMPEKPQSGKIIGIR